MARPTKEGLEYFPLDIDIDQDEKIIVVVAKHGMRGFGVIIRLMMEVYKNGYYYHWTEKEQYVFSMKVGEPVDFVSDVVQESLKWGFFHQEIYEKFGILTSKGFQKRYLLAVNRRKDVMIKPDYNLVQEDENRANVNTDDDNEDTTEKEPSKKRKGTTRTTKKRVYSEDDTYFKMAKYFYDKVASVAESEGLSHLVIRADLQKWADEMRKIVEINKFELQLIRDVMDWVTADPFWRTNVLSAKKLRAKIGELALKMKASQRPKQPNFKQQPQIDHREKEIAFQKWIQEGNNPDEFDWRN